MKWVKRFRFPWRSKRHIETEVDAELRFHIDARTEKLVAGGWEPAAARSQAMIEFGDMDDARNYINAVDRQAETNRRRRDFMGDLVQDVTYAIRKLRKSPTFAITVILTLAVGIGANTAVLNLISATLLKPPAVGDVDHLAWISPVDKDGDFGPWSMPDYVQFREQSKSWSSMTGFANVSLTLGGEEPATVAGYAVSGAYFDVMGVRPFPGRGFLPFEDSTNAPVMSMVIGHAFWKRRFAGDSAVLGTEVRMNGELVKIVGIAPEGFHGIRLGDAIDFWIPFAALTRLHTGRENFYTSSTSRWFRVMGRLAPTASVADAQAEASVLETRLEPKNIKPETRRRVEVSRVRGGLDPSSRKEAGPILGLVMIVPLLVLGVACANVANLFISRSVQRQKELAVRRALGASRGRLVRQLLTECAILGLAAGLLGLVISFGLTAIITQTGDLPPDVAETLSPDVRVLVMTFLLAIGAGALFGLMPALAATRSAITPALKNDGISIQVGRGRHRLRNAFVVSQMALSLTLLITAGLFVGSLQKALTVEPGYDPHNAVMLSYDLSGQGYAADRLARFGDDLIEKVAAMPGVVSATVADVLPLSGNSSSTSVRREGVSLEVPGTFTFDASVAPSYFATMRIPVVRGRSFGPEHSAMSAPVAIVNERLASVLWPGENPIGKRLRVGDNPELTEVIGVAANGKYRTLAEDNQPGYFWRPMSQHPIGANGTLVVRGKSGTSDAEAAARAALRALDPTLPVYKLETMDALIAKTVDGQRAGAALLGVFGVIGLGLAAFGIFGVIAQGVAARTREIGIRMSLGARAGDVVRAFVREGLGLTMVGTVIGVALSLGLSKVLASLLFGLKATDALTFVGATLVLLGAAALASFVPARRAAKVDPLIALRSD
jgi:predicted permease